MLWPTIITDPDSMTTTTFLPARIQSGLLGLMLTLSTLIIAFWISWHSLAQVNFTYALGYDLLEIDQHIQRYGPMNRYRQGFERTSPQQHKLLFAEIVHGIQHGGEGLEKITYVAPGHKTNTLLREAEVVHLQDVANLITLFNYAGIACLLLLPALILLYRSRKRPLPTPRNIATGTLITLMLVGVVLLLVGPTQVFYWLHTKIFPDNHQWFFYYQESLMTTLMKAPDLFGYIAAVWVLMALIIFGAGQWALHRLLPDA